MGPPGTRWARLGSGWNVMPSAPPREQCTLARGVSRRGACDRWQTQKPAGPPARGPEWHLENARGAVECGVHVSAVGTGGQLADAKQLIPAQQLSRGG